jgi:hypothetical protein
MYFLADLECYIKGCSALWKITPKRKIHGSEQGREKKRKGEREKGEVENAWCSA